VAATGKARGRGESVLTPSGVVFPDLVDERIKGLKGLRIARADPNAEEFIWLRLGSVEGRDARRSSEA
jgi:hypothetical protein